MASIFTRLEYFLPVDAIAVAIDLIDVAIILIGAVKFALRAGVLEYQRLRGLACVHQIRYNRMELGGIPTYRSRIHDRFRYSSHGDYTRA